MFGQLIYLEDHRGILDMFPLKWLGKWRITKGSEFWVVFVTLPFSDFLTRKGKYLYVLTTDCLLLLYLK